MQVQIIKATSRHRALSEAKRRFGPDPLVLSVRRKADEAGEETWEAIVARDTPEPLVAEAPKDVERSEKAIDRAELESLRKDLSGFRRALVTNGASTADILTLAYRLSRVETEMLSALLRGGEISERLLPLMRRLEDAGYGQAEAIRMLQAVDPGDLDAAEPDWERFHKRLRSVLAEGVSVAPSDERARPGVVVLVGSAGVGKTTLAAKLAADLCLGGGPTPTLGVVLPRRGVGLETVKRCAEALEIGFVEVTSSDDMKRLADEAENGAPVVLDSSSVNPWIDGSMVELRRVLSGLPEGEIHTVVPASHGDADIQRAVHAFRFIGANRLSVTRLDEAPFVGRVLSASAQCGVPIGYLSIGPRIPDDLARPDVDALIDTVLRPEGAATL